MEKELKVAATWWADQLRQIANHDNGDAMCNAMASWATDKTRRVITDEQIERFKTELMCRWAKRNESNWNPDRPLLGSALRNMATDYAPGGELAEALEVAEITPGNLVLPMKTVMWIDPGKVSVSCGYGAPIEIIYENKE